MEVKALSDSPKGENLQPHQSYLIHKAHKTHKPYKTH